MLFQDRILRHTSEVISSINNYFAEDKAVEETQNNQGALAID